ncbi:hypothetical protein EON80_10875 [bacterium]|nr:MAG: hypothetical protein EON80_10875 [bacterium]
MPVFSSGRDKIFTAAPKIRLTIDGFPDFYALINTARDAPPEEIKDAITSRGADLLAASFSRGGKAELMVLLEKHIKDFRPVLLDKATRTAYDEELRRHEAGEPRAVEFEVWWQSYTGSSALSRSLKQASRSFKERLKAAFWDSEYF